MREISREIQTWRTTFVSVSDATELPSRLIERLREQMAQFLRSNGKFPDFCDIGYDVFYGLYDWHVKNGQELSVGREPDGRYAIQS